MQSLGSCCTVHGTLLMVQLLRVTKKKQACQAQLKEYFEYKPFPFGNVQQDCTQDSMYCIGSGHVS